MIQVVRASSLSQGRRKETFFSPSCAREKSIISFLQSVFSLTGRARAPHCCQGGELKSRFPSWPAVTPERESSSWLQNGVGVLAPRWSPLTTMVLTLHRRPRTPPQRGQEGKLITAEREWKCRGQCGLHQHRITARQGWEPQPPTWPSLTLLWWGSWGALHRSQGWKPRSR